MEYIEEVLNEKGIKYRTQGKDFVVYCLNPEHEESNPSMRIDKIDGKFHCFSCGYKGNILRYFGILTNNVSIKVAKLKEKLRDLSIDSNGLEYPEGYTSFTSSFRGISKATLKKFGAFYTHKVPELEDRIIFPITDAIDNISIFAARHTLSDVQPKYVYYPAGRALPLFPVKIPKQTNTIILVEGIFDFLNCYDKGLENVVCIFGTNTLQSSTKAKLLPYKIQGVTKIYLMFDGDIAGANAAKKIRPSIEGCEFEVEILTLPEELDPGNLDQEYINSIKEYTRGVQL